MSILDDLSRLTGEARLDATDERKVRRFLRQIEGNPSIAADEVTQLEAMLYRASFEQGKEGHLPPDLQQELIERLRYLDIRANNKSTIPGVRMKVDMPQAPKRSRPRLSFKRHEEMKEEGKKAMAEGPPFYDMPPPMQPEQVKPAPQPITYTPDQAADVLTLVPESLQGEKRVLVDKILGKTRHLAHSFDGIIRDLMALPVSFLTVIAQSRVRFKFYHELIPLKWEPLPHDLPIGDQQNFYQVLNLPPWAKEHEIVDAYGRSLTRLLAHPSDHISQYYRVLGVSLDASEGEVRQAYKTKSRHLHPDQGGSQEGMRNLNLARDFVLKAILLNRARRTLLNPELRKQYDKVLEWTAATPSVITHHLPALYDRQRHLIHLDFTQSERLGHHLKQIAIAFFHEQFAPTTRTTPRLISRSDLEFLLTRFLQLVGFPPQAVMRGPLVDLRIATPSFLHTRMSVDRLAYREWKDAGFSPISSLSVCATYWGEAVRAYYKQPALLRLSDPALYQLLRRLLSD